MEVSLVIPTYNNNSKLNVTLDHILASDTAGLGKVEVTVVDDGSPQPVVASTTSTPHIPGMLLRFVRQENCGPAAARNRGFRESRGEITIFIDDDILVPKDLIRKHVDAHRTHPGTVSFGRCPLVPPVEATPLYKYILSLGNDPGEHSQNDFENVEIVASGQISVERSMFVSEAGVYRDDLVTPAAEEFELAMRLHELGVPVLMGTRITAFHNHDLTLDSICRQAFKHAKGMAEVVSKYPSTRCLKDLSRQIQTNAPSVFADGPLLVVKKSIKRLLSAHLPLCSITQFVRYVERRMPHSGLLPALYRTLIGMHHFAGLRAGLREYAHESRVEC